MAYAVSEGAGDLTCYASKRGGRRIWLHSARRVAAVLGAMAFLIVAVQPARAWNDEGHMAVAYLAYQQLRPATRDRVNALLKLNPYYSRWLAAIPRSTSKAETERMIFMVAATWPDQIRTDPQYMDDGPSGGNLPDGPDSSRNIGYADYFRHKYWHFIDLPYSQDGTPLPPVPAPNAATQIAAFRAALGSSQSDDVKSYDLVWLEHLVGDVHQPLHAITRISAGLRGGDAGGNLVLLCSAPCKDELHLFWDRLVGSQTSIVPPGPSPLSPELQLVAEVQAAIAAAKALPRPDARLATDKREADWVKESFEDAKQYVYVAPIGPGTGPYQITQQYFEAAAGIARQRVAVAGARLANLLNSELK